jgi:hypothetical protein
MHHLCNVWFGNMEKKLTKKLNVILRSDLDEIDHFPLVNHARGHENTTTNNNTKQKLNQQGAEPNHQASTVISNPNIIPTNLPQKETI